MKYIHLKVHSTYSLGESSLNIKSMLDFAKKNKVPAIALTDTNNLFGAREFSLIMSENGVKPIIGMQINISYTKDKISSVIYGYVTLLAKSEAGYLNLLRLHSDFYRKFDFNKDKSIDLNNLLDNSEDLILLTGGDEGFLSKVLLTNDNTLIDFIFDKFQLHFKDDLYIELTRYPNIMKINLEDQFLNIAKERNIKIVATNNVFFKEKEDAEANDIVICIGEGTTVNDNNRRRISEEQYLKTEEEMISLFFDLPEALENTVKIAQKCNFLVEKIEPILPSFGKNINEEELLINMAREGLKQKLQNEVFKNKNNFLPNDELLIIKEYNDRLEYELDIIIKMGFSGYFLIVSDFINWSKNNNIPVGPGRGSGAGSLVAWALKITNIDPLRFNLIFERFLNPERISMPDFDIDFCQKGRDDVINYVSNKYGIESVAKIITFGSLQTRAAIRDVGRGLGLPYADVDKICKRIPHSAPTDPITIKKAIRNDSKLAEDIKNNYVLGKLFSIALKLEGIYRNASTHAAGIVIGYKPLNKIIPLYKDDDEKNNLPVAGFSMKYIEDTGLVKFDFLGLTTLTVIKGTIEQIKNVEGITLNIDNIPLKDDSDIKDILSTGQTLGIFQLESSGMREVLKQIMPDKIEDIIAIISLYRPGPMENIPSYINRKHGKEKIEYLHPMMKDILDETFGIMIYQEQVMQIAQKLANYTLGNADLLRRAMGKKKPQEMEEQKNIFIAGAIKNNINEKLAIKIFNQIAKFAGYGFNKSHAAAYALISWQTAYLKAHYSAEFIAEYMTYNMQDTDKLLVLMEDAKNFNIEITLPDINFADPRFIAYKDESKKAFIKYSLLAIKGISRTLVDFLKQELKDNGIFSTIENFLIRVPKELLNKKQLEALIKAGCFEKIENNRNKLLSQVDVMLNFNQQVNLEKNSDQIGLFSIDESFNTSLKLNLKYYKDFSTQEKLLHEASVLGFFISSHPLYEYEEVLLNHDITKYRDVIDLKKDKAKLAVIIMKIKISKTRNNDRFATITCSDTSSVFNIVLFGKNYEKFINSIKESEIYIIQVVTKFDNGEIKLFVEKIKDFNIKLINNKRNNNHNKYIEITIDSERDILKKVSNIINVIEEGDFGIILNINLGNNIFHKYNINKKISYTTKLLNLLSDIAKIEIKDQDYIK